jgi:hypothetical protein
LDDYVDELLNGGIEVAERGHGSKQLDFIYDTDAPAPSRLWG